jgi:hypothetical protein
MTAQFERISIKNELRNRLSHITLSIQGETEKDLCSCRDLGRRIVSLRTRLLLLAAEQSPKRDTSDLDDLETNAGNITSSATGTTLTSNQNFVLRRRNHRLFKGAR